MDNFDCIILGAGTAGSTIAKKLAEAGLTVAVTERKKKEHIGWPWEVSIEKPIFNHTGLLLPPKHLWIENPERTRFYASNSNNYVEINSVHNDVFCIQHKEINQYLLEGALKAGVMLLDEHRVGKMELHKDFVNGVSGERKALFGKKRFICKAPLIVDASGIAATLRQQVPAPFYMNRQLRQQDFTHAWQELHEINDSQIERLQEVIDIEPGMSYTRLGKHQGIEVLHLRKNNTICLIFGAATLGEPHDAAEICRQYLEKTPAFGKTIYSGGSLIPLRRSIDTMVGNGFLCIGDSACQVIPTMGSGVASSLYAAGVGVRSIMEAFNTGDFSAQRLWSYNFKYQSKRGAILASYDIIRRFIQRLKEEDIKEVFQAGLLKNEIFVNTYSSNTISYNIADVLDNLIKIITNYKLLAIGLNFLQAFNDSQKVLQLYKKYPSVFNLKEFQNWQKQLNLIFSPYST